MDVFWFPTHGDSRYLGTSIGARAVDLAYIGPIDAGPTTHSLTGPFGEMIANEVPPGAAQRQAQS
jgi:hypothetical protein